MPNKPEVQKLLQRFPSIPTYRIQPTHLRRVLQPFLLHQATALDLQLVPASTTTKANRANKNEFVDMQQTTGVGSTGVHTTAIPTKNKRKSGLHRHTLLLLPLNEQPIKVQQRHHERPVKIAIATNRKTGMTGSQHKTTGVPEHRRSVSAPYHYQQRGSQEEPKSA
jgi:acetoacetate decarboxylase